MLHPHSTREQRKTLEEAPHLQQVRDVIDRARQATWRGQQVEGYWDAPCYTGPSCTAQMLIALRFIGRLDSADAADAGRWLRARQHADGSFRAHPFTEEGDLCTTAIGWAGLRAAGLTEENEAVQRARAFVEREGGTAGVIAALQQGSPAALFLAMAGLISPWDVPVPPLHFARFTPLMRFLKRRFHLGVIMGMLQTAVLLRHLRGEWSRKQKAVNRICLNFLDAFQNPNGSWYHIEQATLALPTLVAMGIPANDERINRFLNWLGTVKEHDEQGLHYVWMRSSVWSTALLARALVTAGEPAQSARMLRALEWLADSQGQVAQHPALARRRGAPLSGGWSFQRGNETLADCDDTAGVISLFGLVTADVAGTGLANRLATSSDRGIDWLLARQNPDGGWAGYSQGLPEKKPGPVMMEPPAGPGRGLWARLRWLWRPPAALSDPSVEDVTGRALCGLACHGWGVERREVRRAVAFLRRQQCPDGSWWGRWYPNFVPGTATVLRGLAAVGADLKARWIQRGLQWLLDHQNPDGGWGETIASYRDPSLAGVGPSSAPVTGLVLLALAAMGEGDSPAASRAARYLLERQLFDGTWPGTDYPCTLVPPDRFHLYPAPALYYPLEALGAYLSCRQRRDHHRKAAVLPALQGDSLDVSRQQGDPLADASVDKIFRLRGLPSVSEFLTFANGDAGTGWERLPRELRISLEEMTELPAWADMDRIAFAQSLFQRNHREVGIAAFGSLLPRTFACPSIARVLCRTRALLDNVPHRAYRTTAFYYDVMAKGALCPGGNGIKAALRARLLHAIIRRLVMEQPQWNRSERLAVSQEDLAATLLEFGCGTVQSLRRLGIIVSDAQAEAWMHVWSVLGHLLGVQTGHLPRSWAEGEALQQVLRDRLMRQSAEGQQLAAALVKMMQDHCPRLLRGLPVALIRHLAGDSCAELLGLPCADWTRFLVKAGRTVVRATSRRTKGGSWLADRFFGLLEALGFMDGVVGLYRRGWQPDLRLRLALP